MIKIVWDEPKRLANIAKHGLDFAEAAMFDWDHAVIRPTYSGRYRAAGQLGVRARHHHFRTTRRRRCFIDQLAPGERAGTEVL